MAAAEVALRGVLVPSRTDRERFNLPPTETALGSRTRRLHLSVSRLHF